MQEYHKRVQEKLDLIYGNNILNKAEVEECYISKDKIREKIKELNEYYKKEIYGIEHQWADVDITEFYDNQIQLLNELLEE